MPTKHVLSFGGGFFDFDNDGWLDLFIANGHVYEEVERVSPDSRYKQINSLFRNDGSGKFIEVTKEAGNGFTFPMPGAGRPSVTSTMTAMWMWWSPTMATRRSHCTMARSRAITSQTSD